MGKLTAVAVALSAAVLAAGCTHNCHTQSVYQRAACEDATLTDDATQAVARLIDDANARCEARFAGKTFYETVELERVAVAGPRGADDGRSAPVWLDGRRHVVDAPPGSVLLRWAEKASRATQMECRWELASVDVDRSGRVVRTVERPGLRSTFFGRSEGVFSAEATVVLSIRQRQAAVAQIQEPEVPEGMVRQVARLPEDVRVSPRAVLDHDEPVEMAALLPVPPEPGRAGDAPQSPLERRALEELSAEQWQSHTVRRTIHLWADADGNWHLRDVPGLSMQEPVSWSTGVDQGRRLEVFSPAQLSDELKDLPTASPAQPETD
jgi:hypothetical protein